MEELVDETPEIDAYVGLYHVATKMTGPTIINDVVIEATEHVDKKTELKDVDSRKGTIQQEEGVHDKVMIAEYLDNGIIHIEGDNATIADDQEQELEASRNEKLAKVVYSDSVISDHEYEDHEESETGAWKAQENVGTKTAIETEQAQAGEQTRKEKSSLIVPMQELEQENYSNKTAEPEYQRESEEEDNIEHAEDDKTDTKDKEECLEDEYECQEDDKEELQDDDEAMREDDGPEDDVIEGRSATSSLQRGGGR